MKLKKKVFSSETTEPISTKLCWNDSWVVLFQNCVWWSHPLTKMATTVQLRCYWKQLWSRWAITGSWEPLVSHVKLVSPKFSLTIMLALIFYIIRRLLGHFLVTLIHFLYTVCFQVLLYMCRFISFLFFPHCLYILNFYFDNFDVNEI